MNLAAQKLRLLNYLREAGLTDARVLAAIEGVPRERFMQPAFADQAYEDHALPIGLGQTISQPLVVAFMTYMLEVTDRHKVLEIGTGSGYQAAVLSKLCRRVYSVERHKPLLDEAVGRFQALRLHNITARHGDGTRGWAEQAPFPRIIVTAAGGAEPPQPLVDQLDEGGIMVIPLSGEGGQQSLVRFEKRGGALLRTEMSRVRFVPLLPNLPEAPARAAS